MGLETHVARQGIEAARQWAMALLLLETHHARLVGTPRGCAYYLDTVRGARPACDPDTVARVRLAQSRDSLGPGLCHHDGAGWHMIR